MAKQGLPPEERRFNEAISTRVKCVRREKRVGLQDLADAIGVGYNQLYQYEIGAARWPILRLVQVAAVLEVSLTSLLPKNYCVISVIKQPKLC